MSGGVSATALYVMAGAAAAGTAYSIYNGERTADAQKKAQGEARSNAQRAAQQAEQDMNKANAKKPDVAAILDSAAQAGKSGASGTMLTGPQGVDPSALSLAKNTLLGQ